MHGAGISVGQVPGLQIGAWKTGPVRQPDRAQLTVERRDGSDGALTHAEPTVIAQAHDPVTDGELPAGHYQPSAPSSPRHRALLGRGR